VLEREIERERVCVTDREKEEGESVRDIERRGRERKRERMSEKETEKERGKEKVKER